MYVPNCGDNKFRVVWFVALWYVRTKLWRQQRFVWFGLSLYGMCVPNCGDNKVTRGLMFIVVLICSLLVTCFGDDVTDVPVTSPPGNGTDVITVNDIAEFVQTVSVFAGNANTTTGPHHESRIAVEDNTRFICGVHNPCGWSVYSSERTELYFKVSPCDCPTDMVCRRYRDDINIAAYEYRCMDINVFADQQVPPTDSTPGTE
ncbi:hypothetical protein CEXT_363041 [Caerostris extrusa]|uniref:Uncharacterized protein n=1 Tax=Caerostris extrusa TaxID=172846 RepID=A0AAV4NE33_CAEEX|nr:hypothetical protein CEXT_363041 [Caerostris extrusa]